jgi:hypothetical protein
VPTIFHLGRGKSTTLAMSIFWNAAGKNTEN